MQHVPYELVWHIFQYTRLRDVGKLSSVSSLWQMAFRFHRPYDDISELNRIFFCCCAAGNGHGVRYLVTKTGVDANAAENRGLHLATSNGRLAVVKCLVEECNVDPLEFFNPLCTAAMYGRLNITKYFVEECGMDQSNVIPDLGWLYLELRDITDIKKKRFEILI